MFILRRVKEGTTRLLEMTCGRPPEDCAYEMRYIDEIITTNLINTY